MNSFDSIVAGAGIWGSTLARRLAEAGRKVLVLEKRSAIGGNCRCEREVHTYSSHIFHTHNRMVGENGKICDKGMNAVRQISRQLGRTTGAWIRTAMSDSIVRTVAFYSKVQYF